MGLRGAPKKAKRIPTFQSPAAAPTAWGRLGSYTGHHGYALSLTTPHLPSLMRTCYVPGAEQDGDSPPTRLPSSQAVLGASPPPEMPLTSGIRSCGGRGTDSSSRTRAQPLSLACCLLSTCPSYQSLPNSPGSSSEPDCVPYQGLPREVCSCEHQ